MRFTEFRLGQSMVYKRVFLLFYIQNGIEHFYSFYHGTFIFLVLTVKVQSTFDLESFFFYSFLSNSKLTKINIY